MKLTVPADYLGRRREVLNDKTFQKQEIIRIWRKSNVKIKMENIAYELKMCF